MINQRVQNAINKIIEKKYGELEDYIEVIDYIKGLLELSYSDVIEGVFTYLMNKGENPFDEVDIELDYYVGNDDMFSILTNIGWFDKYLTDNEAFYSDFGDIIKEKKDIVKDNELDFSSIKTLMGEKYLLELSFQDELKYSLTHG